MTRTEKIAEAQMIADRHLAYVRERDRNECAQWQGRTAAWAQALSAQTTLRKLQQGA